MPIHLMNPNFQVVLRRTGSTPRDNWNFFQIFCLFWKAELEVVTLIVTSEHVIQFDFGMKKGSENYCVPLILNNFQHINIAAGTAKPNEVKKQIPKNQIGKLWNMASQRRKNAIIRYILCSICASGNMSMNRIAMGCTLSTISNIDQNEKSCQ